MSPGRDHLAQVKCPLLPSSFEQVWPDHTIPKPAHRWGKCLGESTGLKYYPVLALILRGYRPMNRGTSSFHAPWVDTSESSFRRFRVSPPVGEHSLAMAPSIHNPLSPGSWAPNMLHSVRSFQLSKLRAKTQALQMPSSLGVLDFGKLLDYKWYISW